MSTEFAGISESLKEDLDKLSYLIQNLPESPEKDETTGFLKGLLEKIKDGWVDDSGTDEEDEDQNKGDVAGEVSTIVGEVSRGDEEKNEGSGEDDEGSGEDDEGSGEDDEGAGEDDEGSQAGGAKGKKNMFHLSFF